MSRAMNPFLVEFNRTTRIVVVTPFAAREEALRALHDREVARKPHEEVVLFFGESEEMLRRTHSRYFYTPAEMAERLRRLLDPDAVLAASA